MKINNLSKIIGKTDIYLIDQILKNRYLSREVILDVGCGTGRNLHWFCNNDFSVFGIDKNDEAIQKTQKKYPEIRSQFECGLVESLPYKNKKFHHIICNAVLHFAKNEQHFHAMFSELVRVLKENGTLFIRMTSTIGIENKIQLITEGVYKLPDTTTRFLLTKKILSEIINMHNLKFLEPLKTVNVNDLRCMTTLILQKK